MNSVYRHVMACRYFSAVVFIFTCVMFSLLLMLVNDARAWTLMADKTDLFEHRHYKSYTGFAAMDYYLLKPDNYDPAKKYPLVLTLHGASGHSYAAYVLASDDMRKRYPAFVLVPHIKNITSWSLPMYKDIRPEPSSHIVSIIDRLFDEFSIDPSRVYVTGYSVGGYGSFSIPAQFPDYFAAAAPLCGGGDGEDAAALTKTPLWVFHGQQDKGIPAEESRRMVRAIQNAGGKPKYTEYAGMGHGIWEKTYTHPSFWAWMFSQKRQ